MNRSFPGHDLSILTQTTSHEKLYADEHPPYPSCICVWVFPPGLLHPSVFLPGHVTSVDLVQNIYTYKIMNVSLGLQSLHTLILEPMIGVRMASELHLVLY